MEFISFIKNLLIDSLAGISFRNIPFILLQLLIAPLSIILGLRLLNIKDSKKQTILLGILFTLLFIIATTSVPLSILAGFIVLAYSIKSDKNRMDSVFLMLILSFSAGSGHLILLFLTLVILVLFSFFQKGKKNE